MSDLTDKIVDALLDDAWEGHDEPLTRGDLARIAAAVEPTIRAQIADYILREQHNHARVMPEAVTYVRGYDDGLTAAARIAEGSTDR